MNALYKTTAKVMDKVFKPVASATVRRKTKKMDPVARSALAHQVETEIDDASLVQELQELEENLKQAQDQLKQAQEKEQFLGVRIHKYKRLLKEQQERLYDQEKELHEEVGGREEVRQRQPDTQDDEEGRHQDVVTAAYEELDERRAKLRKDQVALQQIIDTHKTILASCETTKRTIRTLTEKRKKMLKMRTECEEFLVEATAAAETTSQQDCFREHGEELHGLIMETEMSNLGSSNHEAVASTIVEEGRLSDVNQLNDPSSVDSPPSSQELDHPSSVGKESGPPVGQEKDGPSSNGRDVTDPLLL